MFSSRWCAPSASPLFAPARCLPLPSSALAKLACAGFSPSAPAAAPFRARLFGVRSAPLGRACRLGCLFPVAKKKQPTPPILSEGGEGCTFFFSVFLSRGAEKHPPEENHARRYSQKVANSISLRCELVKNYLSDNPRKLVELVVGDYRISKRI